MDNKLYYLFKKGEKFKITNNFNSAEVQCKCGLESCNEQRISKSLMDKIQKLREEYGKSITITSAYRCELHNKAIGGATKSQHVPGNAVDISGSDLDLLFELAKKHFNSVGDGRKKGFIHVDVRDNPTLVVFNY